jgi:putative transposase
MRYPASEKLEIVWLVEQSHLPVRRTLEKLGIPRATFYRWYDLYQTGGPEALDDRSPRPDRVWNRIPDDVRERIRTLALDEPALSPRELAVRFTDTESYFVSEASVYRLLKVLDLIARPISRSSAGDGSTCQRCSTTSRATSSPGSCVQR